MKTILPAFFFMLIFSLSATGQRPPWESPLKTAWSADGKTFNTPANFQDSAGVPSVIKWKGDTLVCVFQWFRQPLNSTTWDKVSVKFSYDNGSNWTQPAPIIINGFPPGYQRPFDPAVAVVSKDSLRIYFSSSNGMPVAGGDSIINTYSASGTDGIHYTFEQNARVDVSNNRVIDPSVIYFNSMWHYLAPKGAPQDGAFHYISADGINFTTTPLILSDATHNWTGNYMTSNNTELRFYGCGGSSIWYNSSANGGMWNGYVSTNIQGGDPSVVPVSSNNYLIVYVGQPYLTALDEIENEENETRIYPNPYSSEFNINIFTASSQPVGISVKDVHGRTVKTLDQTIAEGNNRLQIDELGSLKQGIYLLQIKTNNRIKTIKLIKAE